jgi:hypothetical protein
MSTIADVIEKMARQNIHIRSIVGDGFSSQFYGLSPTSGTSIQNDLEYIHRCPAIEPVIYIYCNCHLLNLALHDALESSSFLQRCNQSIITWAHRLRQRDNCRAMRKRCPTYSPTRWCHVYLLCRFFGKHYQSILNLGMRIPPELFAFGLLVEPLFVLISEFEDQSTRFFMRERLLAKYDARMRSIAQKYSQVPYIVLSAELLRHTIFVRMAHQNHDLSLLADAFTCQSKVSSIEDVEIPDTSALYLDCVYEDLINQEAIALAAVEGNRADPGPIEEEDLNEEEEVEAAPEPASLEFDRDEHCGLIATLTRQVSEIKVADQQRGIYQIGCTMIEEHAHRSHWEENKMRECHRQWATWLAAEILDPRLQHALELPPPLFWTSSQDLLIGRFLVNTQLLLSRFRWLKPKMNGHSRFGNMSSGNGGQGRRTI